jgi:hypothetical protein
MYSKYISNSFFSSVFLLLSSVPHRCMEMKIQGVIKPYTSLYHNRTILPLFLVYKQLNSKYI